MSSAGELREEFQVILFDLGGVLVEWEGTKELTKLAGLDSESDATRFWLHSPAVRKFESGRCSVRQFSCECVAELGLSIGPEEWIALFLSWDHGPFPGAVDLLVELGKRHELGCLSNNNELHWGRVCDVHGFGRLFERTYLSHEIGICKPDLGIFQHVLRDLGLPPNRIFYLDDNTECVEAAATLGICAVTVRGFEEACQALSHAQLL